MAASAIGIRTSRWRAERMRDDSARPDCPRTITALQIFVRSSLNSGPKTPPGVGIEGEIYSVCVRESGRAQRTEAMTLKFVTIPAVVLAASALASTPAFAQRRGGTPHE